jgi:metal-responsive CopG/Arc/MetJ family transcriptional regulator
MSVVRMNITLPAELAREIDRLVEPKKKSRFIAQTLQQRIERIQHEKVQKILEEGYKARKKESQYLAKELEPVDLEGWDEY